MSQNPRPLDKFIRDLVRDEVEQGQLSSPHEEMWTELEERVLRLQETVPRHVGRRLVRVFDEQQRGRLPLSTRAALQLRRAAVRPKPRYRTPPSRHPSQRRTQLPTAIRSALAAAAVSIAIIIASVSSDVAAGLVDQWGLPLTGFHNAVERVAVNYVATPLAPEATLGDVEQTLGTDLDGAFGRERFPFPIQLPTYLPDGYRLGEINLIEHRRQLSVVFTFHSPGRDGVVRLILIEAGPEQDGEAYLRSLAPGGQRVDIGRSSGLVVARGDGARVVWQTETTQFIIDGPFMPQIMVQIARSLK